MIDVNKVILIGRLGADPIQRTTKSGKHVSQLSIATSRRVYREVQNVSEPEYIDETQWHKVSVWGKQSEACQQYVKKGHAVYVEGSLRSHQYSDQGGVQRTGFEVYADTISFLGGAQGNSRGDVSENDLSN
jgi:single-strand DNA-binding protein